MAYPSANTYGFIHVVATGGPSHKFNIFKKCLFKPFRIGGFLKAGAKMEPRLLELFGKPCEVVRPDAVQDEGFGGQALNILVELFNVDAGWIESHSVTF